MKRIYHRHERWEDFNAGMYRFPSKSDSSHQVHLARALLGRPVAFYWAALEMVQAWTIAAEANLSNPSRNHQAWVGQATCCYVLSSSEAQTKEAWHMLTPEEQKDANEVADSVVEQWREQYA